MNRRTLLLPAVPVLLLPALAACSDGGGGAAAATAAATTSVVVGAYPMQFVAERVGGDHVSVRNLTPPGAEPHDLELTPRDVAEVGEADLVLALPGLQPALDDAVAAEAPDAALDLVGPARVDLESSGDEGHDEHADEHTEDEHADQDGHDHGTIDPHFWLDPTRLADAADAVAKRLGEIDPDHAADFTERAGALRKDLEALDTELETGLRTCASRDLVTNHTAFAYLANRYNLHQVGITGLSPDAEPSAGTLAEISTFVRDHDVKTIFTETLVAPDTADAVAAETGASTAVLDPLEGLAAGSDGDYLSVMGENLSALEKGLRCT